MFFKIYFYRVNGQAFYSSHFGQSSRLGTTKPWLRQGCFILSGQFAVLRLPNLKSPNIN